MKPGKQPKLEKIQPGRIFFSVDSVYDDDRDTVSISVDEWHVRSVRAKRGTKSRRGFKATSALGDPPKYVNLTRKTRYTWIKKSTKHGDYGWSSSISKFDRRQFRLGDESLPGGIYTTPLQAIKFERDSLLGLIAMTERYLKEYKDENDIEGIEEETKELAIYTRMLKAVERRIKNLSK